VEIGTSQVGRGCVVSLYLLFHLFFRYSQSLSSSVLVSFFSSFSPFNAFFFYFETINTKVAKQQTDFAAMVSNCVPRTKNATSCCQKMAQHTFILGTVSTKILLTAHMIFSRCDFPFDQYLLPFSYRLELVSLQIAVQYCKPSSFCVSSVP
jgi:hypothetical protein